jgi:hypothetical protein
MRDETLSATDVLTTADVKRTISVLWVRSSFTLPWSFLRC